MQKGLLKVNKTRHWIQQSSMDIVDKGFLVNKNTLTCRTLVEPLYGSHEQKV